MSRLWGFVVSPVLVGLTVAAGVRSAPGADECFMHGGGTVEEYIECLKPVARSRSIGPAEGDTQAGPQSASSGQADVVIQFEFDSARLTPQAQEELDKLGAALASSALSKFRYVVEGHTDAAGSEQYNLDLSNRRANTVKTYLVARYKIDPDRLQPVGKGKSELYLPNFPYAAENRRVHIAYTDW